MLLKLVPLGYLFFSIAACNSGDSVASSVNCDQTNIKGSLYEFRNDEFVSNVLQNELTTRFLDSICKDAKKQTRLSKNKYAPHTFDTTVTYKMDCDSVVYISSKANSFPLYMSVQSGRIALDSGFVKIGLLKNEFIEKFHLNKSVPDIIKMTESEGNNEFIFIFAGGALVRIVYNNLYVE